MGNTDLHYFLHVSWSIHDVLQLDVPKNKNPRKRAFGVHKPTAVPNAGDSQYSTCDWDYSFDSK